MRYIHPLPALLGYCHHLAHRQMNAALQQHDLTPAQAHAMLYLLHAKRETTQGNLAQFLEVRPSTVNGIVSRLAEKGFVTRSISSTDARCRQITLTEKGRCLRSCFEAGAAQAEALMIRGFSSQELDTLEAYLSRVLENLKEADPC